MMPLHSDARWAFRYEHRPAPAQVSTTLRKAPAKLITFGGHLREAKWRTR